MVLDENFDLNKDSLFVLTRQSLSYRFWSPERKGGTIGFLLCVFYLSTVLVPCGSYIPKTT